MNKKLIAIAVASIMAAPVAMADVKISGRVGLDYTSTSEDTVNNDPRGFSDSGHTRLQFDGTMGNAYARIALDERLARDQTNADQVFRDNYLGYKFGNGMTLQAGRMAGAAKNIEKDPYIGTFLETRSTVALSRTGNRYGSSSFVDNILELAMKAGAAKIKIQYGASEYANDNNGHIGASVAGKAGAVNYWVSYNNGSADGDSTAVSYASQSNIKVGGAMKFGKVKVSLGYSSQDPDTVNGSTDSIFLDADMSFGNGLSGNLGYGTRSGDVAAQDAEFIRLAVMKKLNKGTSIYGGYTTTDYDTAATANDTDEFGVGMVVKF